MSWAEAVSELKAFNKAYETVRSWTQLRGPEAIEKLRRHHKLLEAFLYAEPPADVGSPSTELGKWLQYGKKNELEDFAESFVAYMVNPGALSQNAKFRMQRALSLSGLHGKRIMSKRKKADLMPPLGYPGGTCHVVKRIDDANPRHEDRLIDLVESGKSLSNSDAAKVYTVEREKGVWKFKNMFLTAHVQYRMDQRGITVPELRMALGNFFRNYNKLKSQQNKPAAIAEARDIEMSLMRGSEMVWTDPRLNRLSIVFTADVKSGRVTVITAMWKGQPDPSPAACKLASRWLKAQQG